ncbi:DUF455 family protein [Paenibacillus sp. IB182496]|uniref:DUF455 family protein n=1 Tax=Paenibacillus sabuli TaxID=2772509 RepID=A0A927BXW7_9BACL|nr:DUF455 family protein [Paenibacillus sabuli]MBD2847434.1 DUF455 family protein [Paenibacillus sabuli]
MTDNGLLAYIEHGGQGGIGIARTADLLRRYAYVEQSCVRALAGWFVAHPDWEVKLRLGHYLYGHAEFVHALRERLGDMRGGNRHAALEPELKRLGEALAHAPGGDAFVAGMKLLTELLTSMYREHIAAADPAANAPELRLLRRRLPELEEQLEELGRLGRSRSRRPGDAAQARSEAEDAARGDGSQAQSEAVDTARGEGLLARSGSTGQAPESALGTGVELAKPEQGGAEAAQWCAYLDGICEAAGGIGGLQVRRSQTESPKGAARSADSGPEGTPLATAQSATSQSAVTRPANARLEWPLPMQFDERLQHADLGTYESKMNLPLRERAIGEFEVYFNEFYAAALLATVIYDSWEMNMPRAYDLEIAHHFWDEVRHAEFGAIRLRELGVEPSRINMSLFEQARTMPIVHRLCYLALGLEVFFMPRKSERARYYEQQGDGRSQLFSDVDWSEEINHVNYGKRWVNHMLEDDARTVQDIQEEVQVYLKKASAAGTDQTLQTGQHAQTEDSGGRLAPW